MKKLIALILILVITSFVVVSKKDTSLEMEIAIEKSRNPNPKNEKWEYIKQEIADEKIDLELDYSQKYQEPILLDLKNATDKDSLAVIAFIKNLKVVFPLKKVGYFSDFVGTDFETYKKNRKALKPIKQSFDVVMSYSIQLSFDSKLQYGGSHSKTTFDIVNMYPSIGTLRENVWNMYNNSTKIVFCFNDAVAVEKRLAFITAEFFKMYWKIYHKNFLGDETKYPNLRQDEEVAAKYLENNPSSTIDKNVGAIKDDAFLITKLFAPDFKKQFETYMYANYPWRYASSFINKKMHEFKVWGIIIPLGILIFALIFSYFQNRKYKYSYLNYLFPIYLILLFFLNLDLLYDYLTNFNRLITWFNSILFVVVFPIVVAPLISLILWGLEKICFKENENFSYQLILKIVFTFLSFLVLVGLVIEFDRNGLFEYFIPYILFSAGLAIGRGLLLYLNHFSESIVKEKEVELSRLKEAKAEAEVKMLQSQINPHFLYNALNSIASLAHTDADKSEKMALSLSDLFRHSINLKGKKVNTLGDEVSLVRNYLEIEQIRFGDRLDFSIDVESDLLAVEIPMFMLQPLVENAIKHGISKIEGQGEIVLKVNKKDKGLLISVQDNGPDFPEGLVSGHGLQTVYDLLRFSYGDKAEISWHNQPKKEITIYIDTVSK